MAQADGRAINEKVRLYARVGAALIAARDNKQDALDAITAVIPWDRFLASVEEAEALARPEEFDAYQMLGEHCARSCPWGAHSMGSRLQQRRVPMLPGIFGETENVLDFVVVPHEMNLIIEDKLSCKS